MARCSVLAFGARLRHPASIGHERSEGAPFPAMKVLFVSGEFPPMQGGVGDYTREIGLALRDLDCEVHVATSIHAGPAPGLAVHPVVARWNWGCWGTLLGLVRGLQPDVVHIQYQAAAYAMHPAINFFPRRLRRIADRPRTLVTFHDLKVPYLFPKAGRVRRWAVMELARRCDAAIATNREDLEGLQHEMGSTPVLIPIGSNIAPSPPPAYDRAAWRARWGAGAGDLLLCFFGFINDRKGVDTLLHALKLLVADPQARTRPLLLFIGGQTGDSDPTNVEYLVRMRSLVIELGLGEHVLWTGYVPPEEVSANFLAADLCVLPFRDGVSFLHGTFHAALAHGLPIIATQPRLALPELVDGGNVLFVPRGDPQALAEAIVRLAVAPDLRRALGKGAQALAQEFRWEKIAADTLALYRTLCVGG
jgi:glycosyltransferase involved in cell wall biosynthesis